LLASLVYIAASAVAVGAVRMIPSSSACVPTHLLSLAALLERSKRAGGEITARGCDAIFIAFKYAQRDALITHNLYLN
jgi:hypothetical protein